MCKGAALIYQQIRVLREYVVNETAQAEKRQLRIRLVRRHNEVCP